MPVSAVIWWMMTSGCAAVTAVSTAWRSSPSTMTGVASWSFRRLALAGERVPAVAWWPAEIRPGTRYRPITPVAPATKTRMMSSLAVIPRCDAAVRAGMTLPSAYPIFTRSLA
jgi:hypothetical protein